MASRSRGKEIPAGTDPSGKDSDLKLDGARSIPAPPKPVKRGTILIGLMLGVLLAALDQTVVGTSLPTVAKDLGGFAHIAWVFTAYMLTSTTMTPIAGKVSDIFGRKPVYMTGMGVFMLGSILCGTATSMTQLIFYRGFQGLGGGMLFPVAIATIADLYAPSERGKVQGAFGACFGLASVIGPFMGGGIVDYVRLFGVTPWRWIFYVNIPVGIAAFIVIFLLYPKGKSVEKPKIDYLGSALLITCLVPLLLVLVWGGDDYAWTSPIILGMSTLAALSLVGFIYTETRVPNPIIPMTLFIEPIFSVSAIASFFMGVSMFGVISFMPTYLQGVVGMSATYSGAVLIPLTLMMVAGSIGSGQLLNKVGYKKIALAGCVASAIGLFLLYTLANSGLDATVGMAVAYMMVLGLGLGFTMQTYMVAVQNVIPKKIVGTATSSIALMRSLGATIGVTILGTLLNRSFDSKIKASAVWPQIAGIMQMPQLAPFLGGKTSNLPSLLVSSVFTDNPAMAPVADAIKVAFAESMAMLFLIGAFGSVVAFAVTVFLKSLPLKSREEYHGTSSLSAIAEGGPAESGQIDCKPPGEEKSAGDAEPASGRGDVPSAAAVETGHGPVKKSGQRKKKSG